VLLARLARAGAALVHECEHNPVEAVPILEYMEEWVVYLRARRLTATGGKT
jgi:hypothetical protein